MHTCHHPKCDREIAPKLLACPRHWYQLPPVIRSRIWASYVPGQEITKTPTPTYLKHMHEALDYWTASA